jgi:mono/diheme cytochrome c family protein
MRRWLFIAVFSLVPMIYVGAFLAMAWIRAVQGHSATVYPSEIETLAVHSGPLDPLADARARGRKIFQHYCQICHGESGKGDGFNAGKLTPPPRDFSQAEFWKSPTTTNERLHFAIGQGGTSVGKSVLMPAWGHTLAKSQIDDVIVYIRAFAAPPAPK